MAEIKKELKGEKEKLAMERKNLFALDETTRVSDSGARKPILCLDFDGVLHSYTSGWQGPSVIPDPPVPRAIEFLYKAIFDFDVQIFSSRSNQPGGIGAMQTWISAYENAYRAEQSRQGKPIPRTSLLLNLKFPTEKPPAMVTLDDRAITFEGRWPTVESLLAFKPWNKE